MGTRSLTVFIKPAASGDIPEPWSRPEEEIVVMYRQMDGYIDGHGHDLANFLAGGVVVNGIGMDESRRVFNGMGCLAAQVVEHFKDGPGGFYLHRAGTRNAGEEYIYEVRQVSGYQDSNENLEITVLRGYEADMTEIFKGSPRALTNLEEPAFAE